VKIIYDEQGNFADLSDEGKQAKEIENNIDFQLFIKKLPEKEQKIAKMFGDGYNWAEIKKACKCSQWTIRKVLDGYKKFVKLV